MKIVVSQTGAREHYAVAQALHRQGLLASLITDWYAFGGKEDRGSVSGWIGGRARAARAEGIPDGLVRAFFWRSLLWKWQVRQCAARGRLYEGYAQTDAAFATAVAHSKLPSHDVFFGYSYASLETLLAEKKRGVLTVLDQIDPGATEFRLVTEEMKQHPEIAGPPPEFPAAYYERNRHEWDLSDVIIVNSEWSREAIIAEGADPAKIQVLPLAYETNGTRNPELRTRNSELPLRVLWLGQVNVRKGIHYLMQAARLLERENVQFDVVGPIGILPGAMAAAPRNMIFHGPVSRDRAAEWYQQADVFVLPTLSDGFALTQLEALTHGLPVITTPHCGRAVEDGKTGFIVPARDALALVDTILKFTKDLNLSASMAASCRQAAKAYSVEIYGRRLVAIIAKHLEPGHSTPGLTSVFR